MQIDSLSENCTKLSYLRREATKSFNFLSETGYTARELNKINGKASQRSSRQYRLFGSLGHLIVGDTQDALALFQTSQIAYDALCSRSRSGYAALYQHNDEDCSAKQHPKKARYGHAHGGPEQCFGRILAETAARGCLANSAAAMPGIGREPQKRGQ